MRTWIRRILGGLAAIVAIAIAGLAIALGYTADCGPSPSLARGVISMKAVVRRCYGPPEVLKVEDIEKPVPADNQLLVRVRAASVNPADWHYVRAEPYLIRLDAGFGAPKNPRVGIDFAGTVEAVGKDVTRYKPGDEVFGGRNGALAEYVTLSEEGSFAIKPPNVSFEQAAGVNVGGLTALQALRDRAGIRPGHKVLINGSSGGVGTFAVQLAKWLGAEVTAVCSTRNVELVRSLGADHVIDYTKEDFTQGTERYDVVMDNVVNHDLLDVRRVLEPGGKHLIIGGGGPDTDPWIGAFWAPLKGFVISWFVDEDIAFFLSHASAEDLATLARLMGEGRLRTVVDRIYPLEATAEAMAYLETGRARGKVIVSVD
jgi:NADPH:quinone reductase-like Zn-dependent oxidoreductase